jgi:circadian clock protein KaiB
VSADSTALFDRIAHKRDESRYRLRLFVSGMTPRSTEAVVLIKRICEELLKGRYELEVVDLYVHTEEAISAQIIAAPTLVKEQPLPRRRLIGNLADRERVLKGLELNRIAQ